MDAMMERLMRLEDRSDFMKEVTYRHRVIFLDGSPDRVFEMNEGMLHIGDSRGVGARFTYNDGDVEWLSDIDEIRIEMSDGRTRRYSFPL